MFQFLGLRSRISEFKFYSGYEYGWKEILEESRNIYQLTPNIILFINKLFHETPNKLSVDVLIEIREMYAVNDSATTKLILKKIG